MGTLVTMRALATEARRVAAMDRAFAWFREIEGVCTRFDAASELRRATERAGVAVPVSPILFEAVRFALLVAEMSGGAFDPTVGRRMEARGFNREYRSGEVMRSGESGEASWRDVELDVEGEDDTAAPAANARPGSRREGAGGGCGGARVGAVPKFRDRCRRRSVPGRMQRPRRAVERGDPASTERGRADCVGAGFGPGGVHLGDYERTGAVKGEHHILDPRTGTSPRQAVSVTVVAAGVMLADALATAAFVLGPEEGIELLEREGVEGLIVTPELEEFRTGAFQHAA